MSGRKDGRPRGLVLGIIRSKDFVEHGTRRYTSLDCRDGQHNACDAEGGCTACPCLFPNED